MSDPSRLDRLKVHAADLEARLDATPADSGSAYAALSGRYVEALRQIEELERATPAGKSALDELAARRKTRRKPINTSKRPAAK